MMHKLTDFVNSLLSKDALKSLNQNNIRTILEFLQEDAEKLSTITKLNLFQILEVRNDMFASYSSPLFDGPCLFAKTLSNKKHLNTEIRSLDIALGGGLLIGYITEICGLAGSGKTQLCFQVAINCSRNTEQTILYIDTKGDFTSLRIQKILDNIGCTHQEMARTLYKIKIIRIWTMEEMIELFKKLKNKIISIENLSLIIVDSLPCLMLQHFGDENKIDVVDICKYGLLNAHIRGCELECDAEVKKNIKIGTLQSLRSIFADFSLDIALSGGLFIGYITEIPGLAGFGKTQLFSSGLTLLNILVNHFRYLGKHYKISIVCVNIQTRWVERDFIDCDDEEDQEKECVEKYNRCLGKYWHHIPSQIILLERIKLESGDSKNNAFSVKATVNAANGIKLAQQCILNVDNFGVK